MLSELQKQKHLQHGFTIVELLIVIVVIGILAAIVIVAYNGIQNRSNSASAQSNLSQFRKVNENLRTLDASNLYPTNAVFTTNGNNGFSKSVYDTSVNYNLVYCWSTDRTEYGLAVLVKGGDKFYISNTKGITPYTQSWTGLGGSTCPNILVNNVTSGTYSWFQGFQQSSTPQWQF